MLAEAADTAEKYNGNMIKIHYGPVCILVYVS
jgi:hypothetical protein